MDPNKNPQSETFESRMAVLNSARKTMLESLVRNHYLQRSNLSHDHKTLAQKNHEELITCLEMIPTVKQFNDVTEWFHDDLGPSTTLYRLARDEICQGPISKALNEGFISTLHVEAFDPGNYIATKGEAGQGTTQFKRCVQRLVFENP